MEKDLKKIVQARNVLRVALYVRVSSQEQAEEGYSIGEQTERLQKYAEAMGWEIYKVYVDPGYSGGNMSRPGLNDMINDVKSGEIDTVVVYKLDRLSRNQFDTLYLIEKVFLANNTDFISMTENFNTNSPLGRAMIGFLAVFAQLEKDKINERTLMGKEARAKEGKWGGGPSEPIGYDYNPTTELLYVNEYEKMQILEAVELFLKGTPLRTICNQFRDKGYTYSGRSGRVAEWDPKRLKYVFQNKVYLGYINHKGDWFKGEHEPILTQEIFDKLQRLLEQRAEMYAHHTKKCASISSYLGGMVYCKQCHGRYSKMMWPSRTPGAYKYYYSCYSRTKRVPKMVKDPNCKNKHWKMQELDELVFSEIRKLAKDPNHMTALRKEIEDSTDAPTKADILRKEINKLDDQISRFMDLYGIGKFTIQQVSDKIVPLNAQKENLERELQEINADAGKITEDEAHEVIQSFGDILDRNDFDEIRLALETLIYRIEIDNEDVYIHWRFI